ncbi:MAG: UTP--glucose-1-phosphate uridylyltransferase GalU [Chloroflexota bacterium]
MKQVRKVVVPAAGFGTRFLPVTKTVPKEMLPIAGKPVIQYVVEEAAAGGIDQVILVTGSNKKAVEDFFDSNFELEHTLEKTGKDALLREVRAVTALADMMYIRQKQPLGNGHAVLAARHAVGDEPFLVLWGDDVILGDPPVPRQLIEVAQRLDGPVISVRRVPPSDHEKYGMLEIEKIPGEDRVARALSVIEKPKPGESPSDLAQIGGFLLTPDIFDLLATTIVGPSQEIYLTDALVRLMQLRPVYTYEFTGKRYDAGNKLEYLKANIELSLLDPSMASELQAYLDALSIGA